MSAASATRTTDVCLLRDLTNDELVSYRREGWILLKGCIDPRLIGALHDEVLGVLATRNMADSFLAQTNEYLRGSLLDGWINSANLRRIAAAAMAGPAHVYLPFTAVKGSGQGAFSFHQDNNYTLLDGEACNLWTALVPMSPENGCLQVVPGSHRDGTLYSVPNERAPGHRRLRDLPDRWVDVHMGPGDICMFHRLTVHASGPNRSPLPRVAYAVQFFREDCQAFRDGTWERMTVRPVQQSGPVPALTNEKGRGE